MNEFQDRMSKLIGEKGALFPCARCGNEEFSITESEWPIAYMKGGWTGNTIPCALLVCTNCGNLVFHSLRQLERVKDAEPS